MKISPIKYSYNPKLNFSSKVVEVGYGAISEELKDKVDKFEETKRANAQKLGQGLTAEAYRLHGTNCVIKVSKNGYKEANGDFSQEAISLSKVPRGFKNAQKLIANVKTEKNNWYLISTFVNGKIPNGKETKWNKESFASLMENLANLDCAHIYHGDVSKCNCLIDENNTVNFLDFQYAEKFQCKTEQDHTYNAEKYKVPYFIAPSNLQMFEESNLAKYLTEIEPKEAKKLYKEYLKEKANYHKARAKHFKKENVRREIIEYDSLMAKYLKNPTDSLINLSAQKLQILHAHRSLSSSLNGNANLMSAVSHYLYIIEKANQMAKESKELANSCNDMELKKLYSYFSEDALFWRGILKDELFGRFGKSCVYDWVLRNTKNEPINSDDSAYFMKTKNLKHNNIENVYEIIYDKSYVNFGFEQEKDDEITQGINNIYSNIRSSQNYCVFVNSPAYPLLKDYHTQKTEVLSSLKQAREQYKDDKNYESMFYLFNALNKITDLKNHATWLMGNYGLDWNQREQLLQETQSLNNHCRELTELTGKAFGKLSEQALSN